MSIYELEIGWAKTANERRYLGWELLAVALATAEAVAVELPVAFLCIWVAQRSTTKAAREQHGLATTHEQGAQS